MNNSITKALIVAESETFDNYFPKILIDISTIKSLVEDEELSVARRWIERVCIYNATQGKKLRGRLVPLTVQCLVKCPSATLKNQAYVLGWCVEILAASYLVADDIMDKSSTRRGVPCWYLVDGLGENAVNDAFLLEHVAYQLIKKHLENTRYYSSMNDLFLDATHKTILGQTMDTLTGRNMRFEECTMNRYKAIAKYKTSLYTFYFPFAIAAIICGVENVKLMKKLEVLAENLGLMFQVLDDYFDCFGSTVETGKDGTDIQNGKCSWLFVRAKEVCSVEQLSELYENYGQNDEKKIARVVAIYEAVNMPNLVYEFMKDMTMSTLSIIREIENVDLKFLYYHLLEKLAKQMNVELPTDL